MKKILFLVLLFALVACDDKKESINSNNKMDKEAEKISKPNIKNEEKDILNQLGFNIEGEKITIDINKTAEFMQKMEIEMHGKADEIERKIEHADINFTKGFGIELDGDKVAIDLNKTKDMLQQINILMKDILLDKNCTIH